mmetsp:Transcript_9663/g.13006  ORF Transcript_9663/g.13006 Transcript_9663/m.13006 type:complete len:212 (+) Transcript_9663:59-694(+)
MSFRSQVFSLWYVVSLVCTLYLYTLNIALPVSGGYPAYCLPPASYGNRSRAAPVSAYCQRHKQLYSAVAPYTGLSSRDLREDLRRVDKTTLTLSLSPPNWYIALCAVHTVCMACSIVFLLLSLLSSFLGRVFKPVANLAALVMMVLPIVWYQLSAVSGLQARTATALLQSYFSSSIGAKLILSVFSLPMLQLAYASTLSSVKGRRKGSKRA